MSPALATLIGIFGGGTLGLYIGAFVSDHFLGGGAHNDFGASVAIGGMIGALVGVVVGALTAVMLAT